MKLKSIDAGVKLTIITQDYVQNCVFHVLHDLQNKKRRHDGMMPIFNRLLYSSLKFQRVMK